MTRTASSIRNIGTSVAGQILNNLLRFVCRTAFIYTLGRQYLGVSSLYTNVLTLLSIAELGFGTAITYSLYRPLADGDEEMVRSLLAFFRKAYLLTGLVILGLGTALSPFLPSLMNGVSSDIDIYLYYYLYLIQTAASYWFFSYKAVLLTADQKQYLADLINYVVQILMNAVQIAVLFLLRSFLIYTIVGIAAVVAKNIATAVAVDRRYPFLRGKAAPLDRTQRKTVFSRIYATFLYKISAAVGTATDNLIISAFIGISMVGIYNNYQMIISVVEQLIGGVIRSFSASLGNLCATEGRDRSEFIFRCLNMLNNILVAVSSVLFLTVLQPFVRIWAGTDWLMSAPVLIIIVLNFATNYMELVVNIMNESAGTFVRGKYRAVATAVINLIVSVALVQVMGLAGVFLGSIISRFVTIWWYDALILYRYAFQKSPAGYFGNYFLTLGVILTAAGVVLFLTYPLEAVPVAAVPVRLVLGTAVTLLVFWLLWHRTEEFRFLIRKRNVIISGIRERRKK